MKHVRIACSLVALGLFLGACQTAQPVEQAQPSEEEYAAWAESHGYVLNPEENGYMKLDEDAVTSATEMKAGGVNYGAIEWDDELRMDAVREFLKGGKYLGDASFAQDESGYNYREMYQMATSRNNIPANTNLEMVLDAETLHLLGVSEANTGKTLDFEKNPSVSISWCRQLREEEESTYNYYTSYGIQFNGKVHIYTAEDLDTEEGKKALINLFDKYYPTLASTWMAYGAGLAEATTPEEVEEAKLAYITKSMSSGASVYYEIIPDNIVITAPFLMNMSPSMANASRFTAVQEGADKYAYDLCLRDEFMDELVAYKAAYIAESKGEEEVTNYYSTGMFPTLDGYCAQMQCPTSLEYALMPNNAAGLKTQTTWTPAQ